MPASMERRCGSVGRRDVGDRDAGTDGEVDGRSDEEGRERDALLAASVCGTRG